ncbi:MAG: site-specific DNA-methyltransferase [Armatimonadetes bacterium]|nr:site-specific DNA-methyltransferase [Armatimonadota bacterium]
MAAVAAALGAPAREGVARLSLDTSLDRVILGDCLKVLSDLPDECVDLVFLDPPYYLQLPRKKLVRWGVATEVDSPEREWDRFSSFAEYDDFMTRVFAECQRLMKPSATIWVIGTYHNIYRVGALMQDLGFWILNDVTWFKTNPMPNWLGVRMTNATETLLWAVRDRRAKGYTYNAAVAKEYAKADFGSRITLNVWRLPICTGNERLRGPDGAKLHPTQKPERLLERVVRLSSARGHIVLDPMAGTGTLGAVASRLGRRFIIVEREPTYAEAAAARLGVPLVVHEPGLA